MKRYNAAYQRRAVRARVVWIALVVTAAACNEAGGPPVIEVDRTACDHCRMLVSDPRFAGAYSLPGQAPRVFDDLGCLLDDLAVDDDARASVWVRDFHSEEWLTAEAATFVVGAGMPTPMAGDIAAFSDVAAARELRDQRGGQVVLDVVALRAARAAAGDVHE